MSGDRKEERKQNLTLVSGEDQSQKQVTARSEGTNQRLTVERLEPNKGEA